MKTQLSLYCEDQLIMYLFIKLWLKIREILFNYQDLSISWESLVVLAAHLKRNFHKLFSTQSKKSDDEQSEIIQNHLAYLKIWWATELTLMKHNINAALKSSIFVSCFKINSDITCYQCQVRDHYASHCTKSANTYNLNVTAVTQSKSKKVLLKSLCQHNKRQR